MSFRSKVKNKSIHIVLPVLDGAFKKQSIKGPANRAINLLQKRYFKNNNVDSPAIVPREYKGSWRYMLDTPKINKSSTKKVYFSGWLTPKNGSNVVEMRVADPDNNYQTIKYGVDRHDVASILRTRYRSKVSDKCGFGSNINIEVDGEYTIEVKIDNQDWEKVSSIDLEYDLDLLTKDYFNPNLSYNMAQHLTLIDTKKRYYYEAENNRSYIFDENQDAKIVAFYLPQFHPIKENDEWWGKGFTEWANVASATPRFIGHEQPKLPADLGFYDLRDKDNIKQQIELAKRHGIYGFCIYYYWFSGKRLLEKPLDTIIENKSWDFNFMICWANENWTRRWDGRNEDVLIEQKHKSGDPLEFIKDIEHILLDERYIRVNGSPALMVYRASDLDDPKHYVDQWREYFMRKHGLSLHLIAVMSFSDINPLDYGFDKKLDFVPLSISSNIKKAIPSYDFSQSMIDARYTGVAYDYRKVSIELSAIKKDKNTYNSVMPSWDNDARKKGAGGVFFNSNPDIYGAWLDKVIKTQKDNDDLVFVNAWNEWAEGAYLEPDTMYGHSFLNRTSEILALNSHNKENQKKFPLYGIKRNPKTKIAVVLHLYYSDMWKLFEKNLKQLDGLDYDLFVTISSKNIHIKSDILKFKESANVIIVPNRGRDVLPFMHLSKRLYDNGYEYVLKLHSKKSTHRNDGDAWMKDMLRKLLPSNKEDLKNLIRVMDKSETGIVGPYGHFVSLSSYYGSNKDNITNLLDIVMGEKIARKVNKKLDNYGFFAGTMFWVRLDALRPIFDQFYQASDFESESGQIDGTFAHAIERILSLVPKLNGKMLYSIDDGGILDVEIYKDDAFNDYDFAKNK